MEKPRHTDLRVRSSLSTRSRPAPTNPRSPDAPRHRAQHTFRPPEAFARSDMSQERPPLSKMRRIQAPTGGPPTAADRPPSRSRAIQSTPEHSMRTAPLGGNGKLSSVAAPAEEAVKPTGLTTESCVRLIARQSIQQNGGVLTLVRRTMPYGDGRRRDRVSWWRGSRAVQIAPSPSCSPPAEANEGVEMLHPRC